jgi:hypothetical protein
MVFPLLYNHYVALKEKDKWGIFCESIKLQSLHDNIFSLYSIECNICPFKFPRCGAQICEEDFFFKNSNNQSL